MRRVKLSEWADMNGLTYHAAWKLFHKGQLPSKAIQLESGTILVEVDTDTKERPGDRVVTYARVSSSENKSNLLSQSDRLTQYAILKGWREDS